MFKAILVPATGSPTDAPVFATALAVARSCSAHITFLHPRVDARRALVTMAAGDPGGGAWIAGAIDSMENDAAALERRAFTAVKDFCAQAHLPLAAEPGAAVACAEWSVGIGESAEVIAEHGRVADLIIAGRGARMAGLGRDAPREGAGLLEAALLRTGRPLLLVPEAAGDFAPDTVAIAWKSAPEAAHALTAAAPFLDRAKNLVVIALAEAEQESGDDAAMLARALAWRLRSTQLLRLPPGTGEPAAAVLDAARAEGAGLLVMGGYSHARMREIVLGGFTRHVLAGAALPILMVH